MRRWLIMFMLLGLTALLKGQALGPGRASCTAACAAPPSGPVTFSPPSGSAAPGTVTLTTSVSGGTIFYTTDGSTPTIASPRCGTSGCTISVPSAMTVNALAAVIYIDASNQNQNTTINNSGSTTFHWKPWCYLPGCDPGGFGIPQAATTTFGIVSPVMGGAGNSMELSMTSDASTAQTNALFTSILKDCTSSCTQWMHDFYIYYDAATFANLSESEHDQFWFDDADGIRYMFGMQWYKAGGQWQLVGNSNVPWTNSGVTTALSSGTWNHIQLLTHRVPGELATTPCTDGGGNHWPYLYYDQLNLNGTINQLNQKYCANANPTGWTGEGMQHQINIANTNVTENEYYSQDNFIATGDSSAVATAIYH